MEERDEQQGTTAPYAAGDLRTALAHHPTPAEDCKVLASYLRRVIDAWAGSEADDPEGRALARARCLRLVKLRGPRAARRLGHSPKGRPFVGRHRLHPGDLEADGASAVHRLTSA